MRQNPYLSARKDWPDDLLTREKRLHDAMESHPDDESAKLHYEEFLAEVCPAATELELLRQEREIAESWQQPKRLEKLVEQYRAFRTDQHNFFWDSRGFLDAFFRRFNLWLVSFAPNRRFALEQALALKLKRQVEYDLNALPTVIVASTYPHWAYDQRNGILDFIRRYRGPSGAEPPFDDDEVAMLIAPTWIASLP